MANITIELQETLKAYPNIKEVHFDARGRHYFNVHSLRAGHKDETVSLYGQGYEGFRRVIPGEWNVDKLKEVISFGEAESKIVETVSREDVLAVVVKPAESPLVSMLASATPEELAKLAALLKGIETPTETTESGEGKKSKK